MKGIVFNLLEESSSDNMAKPLGRPAGATGLAGSYTSLGNYPPREMEKLVLAVPMLLKITHPRSCGGSDAKQSPCSEALSAFFTEHHTTRSFVLSVKQHHPSRSAKALRRRPLSFFRF